MDDSLLVDISDALSERDRVRFTVHTRTKLPQFAKPVLSVVRQHEEFIWLHDCLVENDQYAGYIIPPPPPKPDFDSSKEKLQRLGDCEASLSKEEFAKMKQELESEYLAIFKKTVAMHEIFLQRLASHEKFRNDNNFKIFLEYENELAVRGKSKREKIAGSISNISKSLADLVITTSQVANSNSISSGIAGGVSGLTISNHSNNINYNKAANTNSSLSSHVSNNNDDSNNVATNHSNSSNTTATRNDSSDVSTTSGNINGNDSPNATAINSTTALGDDCSKSGAIDEQYFEKERLFLALYHNSIKDTAFCADKVAQAHKAVADSYLNMAQQLVRLASIEVVPVTAKTVEDISSSGSIAGPLPSLTLPAPPTSDCGGNSARAAGAASSSDPNYSNLSVVDLDDNDQSGEQSSMVGRSDLDTDTKYGDTKLNNGKDKSTGGCANDHTSEGLKKLLVHVSDYLEQAKKVETRIASDEDLKLTDTFLYYKRDTVAAQDLLARRLRFMSEYETATKNLERARVKGRTATQYADVIQKQARENFLSISKQAKQELIDYKKRRVSSFKKAFGDLAELEVKHLRSHFQLITNCLNICRGETVAGGSIAGTSTGPAALRAHVASES